MLLKTLPNPCSINEYRTIKGARPATSPLPSPPPAGPQSVQRRVPKDGVVMVAGQRFRVGRTHAGTIVTVVVEDHHFRVLDGNQGAFTPCADVDQTHPQLQRSPSPEAVTMSR
ncbi:Mu transposase domain-containing protein [Mycolicibacterium baixiangningiae]|uniref:Mu transposase domain-containing protein n=1 Tax=Mycolicibacterium baixiangningiae TaxID=2761578 RepID=UPI00384C95A3